MLVFRMRGSLRAATVCVKDFPWLRLVADAKTSAEVFA
jgi:hypothetical protein